MCCLSSAVLSYTVRSIVYSSCVLSYFGWSAVTVLSGCITYTFDKIFLLWCFAVLLDSDCLLCRLRQTCIWDRLRCALVCWVHHLHLTINTLLFASPLCSSLLSASLTPFFHTLQFAAPLCSCVLSSSLTPYHQQSSLCFSPFLLSAECITYTLHTSSSLCLSYIP